MAAYYARTETAELLHKLGADPEAVDNDGMTPLAVAPPDGEEVRALLRNFVALKVAAKKKAEEEALRAKKEAEAKAAAEVAAKKKAEEEALRAKKEAEAKAAAEANKKKAEENALRAKEAEAKAVAEARREFIAGRKAVDALPARDFH